MIRDCELFDYLMASRPDRTQTFGLAMKHGPPGLSPIAFRWFTPGHLSTVKLIVCARKAVSCYAAAQYASVSRRTHAHSKIRLYTACCGRSCTGEYPLTG